MPGHPVVNDQQTREAIHKLDTLIEQHDAIFLLMDSRESRWLPTLLGAIKQKVSHHYDRLRCRIDLYNVDCDQYSIRI
jgi:hypothetical protein